MNYGYIRVSTDKQTTQNQRFEITNFAATQSFQIDKWIEETISASRKLEERKFGKLLRKMQKGDLLIVTELSRMGRNLMQIMKVLHDCMEKDVRVLTVKERYELGNNINSKVLAFAFGLSAEIERTLISQRTKEALARLKAEGKVLGRPVGSNNKEAKLDKHEAYIRRQVAAGAKQIAIARSLKVCRQTVGVWVKENITDHYIKNSDLFDKKEVSK